jgi:hypothetical protein
MSTWATIGRTVSRCTTAFFLVVFAGIIGANVGTLGGSVLATWTGEWVWVNHGRCAGWSLFVVIAVIGIPTGHSRFGNKPRVGAVDELPGEAEQPGAGQPVTIEGRLKSLLVAPLLGAFMGLIVGGIAGGFFTAIYFFAALSPFGPGGWWPILPLTFRGGGDGFSSNNPWWLIPWLIIVGTLVSSGALLGLFTTVTFGKRRFDVFSNSRAVETHSTH